jgi:hypothetical protein
VILASVVSSPIGLWWAATTATLAAVPCVVGALRGVWQHRIPRMLVGVGVTVIAVSYWADIVASSPLWALDVRRGAGWVLWPALAWTAWSGIVYSRRVVAAAAKLTDGLDGDG